MKYKENVCTWILIVGILSGIASCNKSNVIEVKGSMDGESLISYSVVVVGVALVSELLQARLLMI